MQNMSGNLSTTEYAYSAEMAALDKLITETLRAWIVVCPVSIAIIFSLGFVGNLLVIYVTMKTGRVIQHPMHSMLVLNLSVSDLIYLLASAPYQISGSINSGWIYGSFMCPAFYYIATQTTAVSIFTICSLALMRYIALMMPFKMQNSFINTSSRRAGWLVIIFVWIAGSLLSIPNAIYYRVVDHSSDSNETKDFWICHVLDSDKMIFDAFYIILFVFTYAIPFLLVTVLYFFIGREVMCYMRNKETACSNPTIDRKRERKEYVRITVMVFSLIIAFLVCWFPYHLYIMMEVTESFRGFSHAPMKLWLYMAAHFFSYVHACVNPIIYTFAAPEFRRSLRRILKRKKQTGISNPVNRLVKRCHGLKGAKQNNASSNTSRDEGVNLLALPNQKQSLNRNSCDLLPESMTSCNATVTTFAYTAEIRNSHTGPS